MEISDPLEGYLHAFTRAFDDSDSHGLIILLHLVSIPEDRI
jgi:hypothetical protein